MHVFSSALSDVLNWLYNVVDLQAKVKLPNHFLLSANWFAQRRLQNLLWIISDLLWKRYNVSQVLVSNLIT